MSSTENHENVRNSLLYFKQSGLTAFLKYENVLMGLKVLCIKCRKIIIEIHIEWIEKSTRGVHF